MRRFSPLLLFLAAVVPPRTAQAQGGPVLFEPFDWGPNAAWRRRAAEVRTLRDALLRQGDLRSLNAVRGGTARPGPFVLGALPTTAVTGAFHVPVIAIAYKDVAVQRPISQYQCLLFSRNPGACVTDPGEAPFGRPYSVTSFYEQLSHNRITMDGVVLPAVRVDSNAAYYTNGCNGIGVTAACPSGRNRMGLMLVAALDSISARPGGDTLWGQFDNDGPDGIPNSGDDDGVVDFVTFIQPELGGECVSNTPKPTGVWSHRYVIRGWTGGLVQPNLDSQGRYVTRTPRKDRNGNPIPSQFILVDDYTIQSGVGGGTACDGTTIMGIGTVAHETGHAFGLPDLYDISGSTQGIGGWGLMGSGNYSRPYSPSSYDAWSLYALGWATLDTLSTSRTVLASPRLLSDTIYYARTANPDEYLLIENRQAVMSDSAQMNPSLSTNCPGTFGFCAKAPGLLLWLIDQPKLTSSLFGNSVNVSSGGVQGVELIQADGLNQLRLPGSKNRGDVGDSYPGSTNNTRFTLLASPSARDNFGNYIGFTLDQISQLPAGRMSFRFLRRNPTVVSGQGGASIRVNGTPWTRFEEVVAGGDLLQLGADDLQLLAAGKSRARFLAWSQGGPREQLFTSSANKPDTLTASFALEHRLSLISTGGTVNTSVIGDLTQGVFLAEGTAVTLNAVTPQGSIFSGWRGDTVATNPVLNLTMRRGYDLEAHFVAQVNVVATDAVSELLGTPKLSDAQRAYLDELGNQNGLFDVGDLLAMYRRLGQAAPPALLRVKGAKP